jgi:hypothetical protein
MTMRIDHGRSPALFGQVGLRLIGKDARKVAFSVNSPYGWAGPREAYNPVFAEETIGRAEDHDRKGKFRDSDPV